MKNIIRILLPPFAKRYFGNIEERLHWLEFSVDILIKNPKYVSSEDIGFGGQLFRKQIFRDLLSVIDFEAIVETGTYIGDTAGYMQEVSKLPVYSCEIRPLLHSIAKMRLCDFNNIHLELSDSIAYLNKLAVDVLPEKNVFFYLDAHLRIGKSQNMPLREEVRAIATHWENFVIMIDDFMVPNDEGYRYMNWGKGKALSLGLIDDLIKEFRLIPYFPSASSSKETGRIKSGCVVLSRTGAFAEMISQLDSLTCPNQVTLT